MTVYIVVVLPKMCYSLALFVSSFKMSRFQYATGEGSSFYEAVEKVRQRMGYSKLKEKQVEAIAAFVQGRDTVVLLPTGYE